MKFSQVSLIPPNISDTQYSHTGVWGVAVFPQPDVYADNDPHKTVRIRAALGSISPSGLVNKEVEVLSSLAATISSRISLPTQISSNVS